MVEKKKMAVLFPGQGSQYIGMGREFIESNPLAAEFMTMAEKWCDVPLRRFCLDGPMDVLVQGGNLQPAITAVNLLCWQALQQEGITPHFVAGHSLGEFSALCAAGVLGAEDALRLTAKRGALMEREAAKHPGSMMAVIGSLVEDVHAAVEELCDNTEDVVVVANHNAERQVVISGHDKALLRAREVFSSKGCKVIPLNVSIPNHSPLVAGAVSDFESVLAATTVKPPSIPLFFNVTAAPESDPDAIKSIMARQMVSMVRWHETILHLWEAGVGVFVEVGPKNVLSGLLKRILDDGKYKSFQIDTPAKLKSFIEVIR